MHLKSGGMFTYPPKWYGSVFRPIQYRSQGIFVSNLKYCELSRFQLFSSFQLYIFFSPREIQKGCKRKKVPIFFLQKDRNC